MFSDFLCVCRHASGGITPHLSPQHPAPHALALTQKHTTPHLSAQHTPLTCVDPKAGPHPGPQRAPVLAQYRRANGDGPAALLRAHAEGQHTSGVG